MPEVLKSIELIIPKTGKSFYFWGEMQTPISVLSRNLSSPDGGHKGWYFGAGDPEFWKFSDKLLVPEGKVLDLGMGFGRSSMFFAMNGMKVTGYEINPSQVSAVEHITNEFPFLSIDVKAEDMEVADFGDEQFDTLIIDQALTHFPSRERAYLVLDKAVKALKSNGHLYLRAPGDMDSGFDDLLYYSKEYPEDVGIVDDHTFIAACSCSGRLRMESQLFFNQTELLYYFIKNGFEITHMQTIPVKGMSNTMFGEDGRAPAVGGEVTYIVKKLGPSKIS